MTITSEQFSDIMNRFGIDSQPPHIAVAVSGGGDSLALTMLMDQWVKARGGKMIAMTVDHKLRPDSTGEAKLVGQLLKEREIEHVVLTWTGEKPTSHIQELAREARYRLLMEECKTRKISMLAVAHNLEDKIETFWMRLSHGSGLDGLAAMASMREFEGIRTIRPVMEFTREELRATCRHYGSAWLEDPSNADDRYLRVKLRRFENQLAAEGMTPQRLAQTIQKLEEARSALDHFADIGFAKCVSFYFEGYAGLSPDLLAVEPLDIQRRILAKMLHAVAPQPYPVGFEALEQLRRDVHNLSFTGKTIAGCDQRIFIKALYFC